MRNDEKALLFGMAIGDGYVKLQYSKPTGNLSTATLAVAHSEQQLDYLKHKAEMINKIFGGEVKVCSWVSKSGYNVGKTAYSFHKTHKYFKLVHKWLYSNNNKKYITEKVLNRLTPQAVAIWYMDDGGVSRRKDKGGRVTSVTCRISTYCTEPEADAIVKMFQDRWNITWKKRLCRRTQLWFMECNTTESRKFEKLIHEYIIPSMRYKLPMSYLGTSAEQPQG